jgi:hypothetical protein
MSLDRDVFADPPTAYRSGPLWVWNDTMAEPHLDEQIGEMADAGWGAFFVHPRYGVAVDYLSEEWCRKVAHSVERAIEVGVDPWLYDEFLWPSGYGNGAVPAKGPEYRIKFLLLRETPAPDDDVLDAVERDGETRYLCRAVMDADSYGTAGGDAYVDLLNPDAVEAFVDVAYEGYADAVGEYFGDVIPGVFTDEPQIGFPNKLGGRALAAVPWTAGLPDLFEAEHGYDLLECLPALFYDDLPGDRDPVAVRYDFWRFVTERFATEYTGRLAAWCEERDLSLVGHYLLEDTLSGQIPAAGAVMPHYEHEHMPGMDFLGRYVGGNGTPLAARQASSAARQFDRTAFSELYGTSGQQFSFATRKWLGEWHLVHGVTFLNHHISLYSMRGERKRDYPPNVFYQQPWWPYNDRVADHVARTVYALRQGEAVADTLVLHPVQSGWLSHTGGRDESDLRARDEALSALLEDLLDAQVTFDLGDETLLAGHGGVAGDRLRVGEATYGRVVLPDCDTLQAETVSLLEAFVDAGGDVLVLGSFPERVDGRRAPDRLATLRDAATAAGVGDVVDAAPRPVRLEASGESGARVRVNVRRLADDSLVAFVANTDPEHGFEGALRVAGTAAVSVWDRTSGEVAPAAATAADGATTVPLSLAPAGSVLLTADPAGDPSPGGRDLGPALEPAETRSLADADWTVRRADPNALVLDRCDLVLDGEDRGEVDVSEGWIHPHDLDDPAEHVPFEATYRFAVDPALADGPLAVVVESADELDVACNGTPLGDGERWRDVHWHRIDVSESVRPGANELTVSGTRTATAGVEPVFVLGDFDVPDPAEPSVVPESPVDGVADLTDEGYPFFTGAVTAETTVSVDEAGPATLAVDDVHAALARVRVNGGDWRELYWPPWRVPLDLEAGENRLEVRLVTSLRNLTGPHHAQAVEPADVSPYTFRRTDPAGNPTGDWHEGYHVVPVGLEGVSLHRE